MLRVEIPDDVLIRAVSDAVERQLSRINEFTGYVDLKGACKYLSVGESQFKEWVRFGYIHPRKVSSHLVRYRMKDLENFMEQFKIERQRVKLRPCLVSPLGPASGQTTREPAAR